MEIIPAQGSGVGAHARADAIIRLFLSVAPKLLKATPAVWETEVVGVLKELGMVLSSWRVYAIKLLQPLGETPYGYLRYEWKRDGSQSIFTQETAPMQELEMLGMSAWLVHLRRGEVVCTRKGEGAVQDGMWNVSPEMKTLVLVPIYLEREWWGYLGIEDEQPRIYEREELEALKAFSQLLSSAIWRKRNDQQLLNLQLGADRLLEACFMTNRLGTFIYTNKAFSDLYGFSADEIFGQTPRILKSGKHDSGFYSRFWDEIKEGVSVSYEMVNRTKMGYMVRVDMSVAPIINEYRKIAGYLAIQRLIKTEM